MAKMTGGSRYRPPVILPSALTEVTLPGPQAFGRPSPTRSLVMRM
jgi:hypothetical protein